MQSAAALLTSWAWTAPVRSSGTSWSTSAGCLLISWLGGKKQLRCQTTVWDKNIQAEWVKEVPPLLVHKTHWNYHSAECDYCAIAHCVFRGENPTSLSIPTVCTRCRGGLMLTRCLILSLYTVSDFLSTLLSLTTSCKLTSCTRRGEPGDTSLTISHVHRVSQRLMKIHSEIPAFPPTQTRGRQACLNVLCFCHNGKAFGGFADLLQRIKWSILHNVVLLSNPNINISPP